MIRSIMPSHPNEGQLSCNRGSNRGFSLIESIAMLVAIGVFSWICLGVLKLKKIWPFDKTVSVEVQKR